MTDPQFVDRALEIAQKLMFLRMSTRIDEINFDEVVDEWTKEDLVDGIFILFGWLEGVLEGKSEDVEKFFQDLALDAAIRGRENG